MIKEITDSETKTLIYNNLGVLYDRKSDARKAIKYYTKAIKIDPYNYIAYSNRASDYVETGNINKALEDLNKCISINKKRSLAYYNKAYIFYKKNEYNKALKIIKNYKKVVSKIEDKKLKSMKKTLEEEVANE